MRLLLVGVSHRTASVEVRERLAPPPDVVPARLRALCARRDVGEALALSTCNRCELYVVTGDGPAPPLPGLLAQLGDFPPDLPEDALYVHEDLAAVRHLFRVAAGVESQVFGETEIMGQVKQAVRSAREAGAAGRVLLRLGDRALTVGRRVRTQTAVDRGRMSVASVAVDLARRVLGDLACAGVLVIGAGETGALVARRMVQSGARHIVVTSRTAQRARDLAERLGAGTVGFDDLMDEVARADVVISCTGAPHHLITVEGLRSALAGRRRPCVLMDLAVPRASDPAARRLDGVHLHDIDDLRAPTRECERRRRRELPRVEAIVDAEARDFLAWLNSRAVRPPSPATCAAGGAGEGG